MSPELVAVLLANLRPPATAPLEPEAHEALRDALEGALARCAHGDLLASLGEARLVAYLARRLEGGADLTAQLARVQLTDLCLACACEAGDARAVERFYAGCRPALEGALRGLGKSGVQLDELQILVFQRLFLPHEGRPPRIEHYRGEGELRAWVKVVAARLLLNRVRDEGRAQLEPDRLLERALDTDPADLRYMKALYREQFRLAFARALESLAPRDRTLLRFQLVDGMSGADIAKVYRVNRATVHRWQKAIQQALLERTRQHLERELAVEADEVDSIVRMIQSTWQVSVVGLLQGSPSVQV